MARKTALSIVALMEDSVMMTGITGDMAIINQVMTTVEMLISHLKIRPGGCCTVSKVYITERSD